MKKRFLLFGLIFALTTVMSHAQIYEVYTQDFETGTPATYTGSSSTDVTTQTTIVSGGSRALKMLHRQGTETIVTLDTIDLSFIRFNYYVLEFMHINWIDPSNNNCASALDCSIIEAKCEGEATWTQLNSTHYRTENGSTDFPSTSSFSIHSYPEWDRAPGLNNTLWIKERFDLDQLFYTPLQENKKLILRFRVKERLTATAQDAWYIDDIRIRASTQPIRTPKITMRSYPDMLNYPSSRGAKMIADVTTTVSQGINGDSVYIEYRVGNSTEVHRSYMHRQGTGNRFVGRIPMYGYDTLIHYHVIAQDSTVNHNTVYFPDNMNQWLTYRCVRGKTHSATPPGTQTTTHVFPFPSLADNRSEWIYDSVTMADMGYGPGNIKTFRFLRAYMSPNDVTRPHLQIRMMNSPNSLIRDGISTYYTSSDMQIVYDSAFTFEQAAALSYKTVNLQDTFFYAGSDIVIQILYDGTGPHNPSWEQLKHIPTPTNKQSLYSTDAEASLGWDAFGANLVDFAGGNPATTRPFMVFFETQNVPLIYDCGISGMSYPSYDTPCHIGTDSVVVWLKNYGVSPMNAVRIWYRIDNGNLVHYDWTGTLNGGDSVRVHVCDSQMFTVGYHTIRAWVDDTITIDTLHMRDHEPYNDTMFTPFASCDGPYSGVRTIGNAPNDNFRTLEDCLYVLSRCGIDAPLTVKMPAGVYDVTKFPYIPGTSATNYVQFEPAIATGTVTFRRARRGENVREPMLVDLTEAHGIRFNNITFSNGRYTDNRCDVLAQLGDNSAYCQFINCTFADSNTINSSAQSLINTGNADSVTITNCTFYGGTIGVDVTGAAPDVRSSGNVVSFNNFTNQVNSAIRLVNQDAAVVDSNFANDVLTNASYIILGQYCYNGTRITRNRVYSTKGTCCIGVSDMHGNESNYCIVANNMLVSVDDGTSNMLTTPLNIIKGSYIKTVFNSVRMNAPTRVNVAGATFGGDVISNSYFQNNVIATFDTSNYAFSFIPGDNAATLHVDHNCYYSISGVLNKLSGSNYNNLNGWRNAVPGDVGSVSGNPNYTNGSVCRVDLRSFNALLRNVGVPVPEVTIDLFGSTRSATAPSLGAYEVTALSVDFRPEEFVTPMEDYCGAPASIPVEVAIRNTGNGTYTASSASPMTVYYSIDNGPVQSFVVNRDCGPNDTIHFLSTRTMALPSGAGNTDRTYNIKWWVKCNLDPDDLNDTSTWTVLSRYAAPAPTVINQNVAYNNVATITPTAGVNTWPVSYYTSGNGRQQRSGISWYHSLEDTAAFFYGPTLTTTPLYDDTTFYISQKRNLPLVKITEVQVSRTAPGVTYPLPSWMHAQTTFAVELTNCGDYPAQIEGDSIIVVQSNAAAKIWVLPNVTIQPGENLILQFRTSTVASDSTHTIYAPSTATVTPPYTANFGVIYRDGHGVADAVAFNNVITTSSTQPINWSNQQIPAAVWQGSAIDLARNGNTANTPTAGARRIAWPTNAATASPTASASLWQVATDSLRMHIGETESNLIRYFDNGCEGFRSAVNIHVTGVPNTDLFVDEPVVDTGCNLTTAEPVSVLVHNYGANPVPTVVVKYSLDGGTTIVCADTIASGIGTRSEVYHTFSTPINMQTSHDTVFHIKAWVDAVTGDNAHANDTNEGYYTAKYTPSVPQVDTVQTVNYGERLTITASGLPSTDRTIWYDKNMNNLGVTNGTYITDYIYRRDTMFVRSVALMDLANTHIGTLASVKNNSYPSPYNPKTRYVKEQYLVTAQQLQDAGHAAGDISSLSFYLESLGANVSTFTYSYYTIKMGTTTQSVFANGTFLSGLTQVYNKTNYTLTSNDLGWVRHNLDAPFAWDGTSNIVIEITRALSTAGINNGANTRYTAQANTVISKQHATTDQASQTSGTKGNDRPDILFGFLEPVGCESATSPIYINVTNIPDNDASLSWPEALDTTVIASCDTTSLDVVLENRGNNDITSYTLRYKIDNQNWQQITGNANNLPLGYNRTVPLLSTHFTPGRHTVIAVVNITGDTVPTNDTIRRTFNVRFCAGTYSIGSCGSDYPSITTALDTLHNSGVAGPVVFELCEQTFNEQLNIEHVDGTDVNNTVTFKTVSGATDLAKITHTPTNTSNHVMSINGADYITFDSIYFYANYTSGSGNNIFANVAKVEQSNFINFRNCVLRSKMTTASSTNANLLLLGDNNHYITVNHCVLDSGYYSVRSIGNNQSDNISVTNSDILNFWFQGVYLRNTDTVTVTGDSIASGVTVAGKPLTGIYIAGAKHASIQRNYIHLIDSRTGGKRGIVLNNCRGTNIDRVTVYNNMVSVYGTGVASLSSSGIWVDSLSKHVSVYYNTCNLYAGANQAATRTFSCQNSSYIHALNNIFKNESKGFAYYIAIDTCMSSSNYNVYWTNADTHATTGVIKFAWWGVNCNNLDSLRLLNHADNNSYQTYPYFVDSIYNLSTTLAQFADRAQYNPDVITDIKGCIRPQIPKPTIGAYEFNCIRETHDVAVAEITEPYVPSVTTGNNPIVLNIETDSIMVRAKFFNNGTAVEQNLTWYAYMGDTYPVVQSATRTINRLAAQAFYEDSVLLESPLGIVDTQNIVVVINMAPGIVDQRPEDNIDTAQVFIYPAYDLQVVSVAVDSTCDPAHCRMYSVPLRYTLKNAGKKDFPGDFSFTLGYDYYCHQPSTQSFPNFPGSSSLDVQTFGGLALPVGTPREVTLSAAYEPNLYPTGTLLDITARLRGFVTAQYDIKQHNDTTNYINITSNHTPEAPVAHDTMVDYGTYGNLWATQGETRAIRWTRDTTDGSFFYNGNNNYNRSTHWSNTPQYFHDSLYYLYCLSSRNCTSYYSQINVGINMPLTYDVSISEVRSPRGSGRVYLEKDTVTLRVVNYGAQPISNIPIAFKFMDANGRITYLEVHDTVRATIPGRVGDNVHYYDHTFGGCLDDTAMLMINLPLANRSYTLNAWVYHPDDQQRGNDTLRFLHTFKALAETTYDTINKYTPTSVEGFDITHVSFNELDNRMPDLIGYDNLWLGSYNPTNAEIPTLFVRRGTQDTLTIEVANNLDELDSTTAASLCVAIDYNRDGQYDFMSEENLTRRPLAGNAVKVHSRQPFKMPLTIPESAHYGYMRMLVWVHGDSTIYTNGLHTATVHDNGQLQQYMLYVQEDCMLDTVDAALTRVVTPRNHIVSDADYQVTIMLANKGSETLTQAKINYRFVNVNQPEPFLHDSIQWAGNLEPGMSVPVILNTVRFPEGTTNLYCSVEAEGDTFHISNNNLQYQYHRYFVLEPRYIDSFDQAIDRWYAPVGYNAFTRNYFERGMPAKSTISSAYSQPNAYITSATESIVSGKHGNRSVLYSPIINIQQIHPDTITFLLSMSVAQGALLRMEYIDYQGIWRLVEDPSIRWGGTEPSGSWYDEEAGWNGTNNQNGAYRFLSFPTSLISTDFPQHVQFRFVFTTPVATSPAANFGDGVAIDNLVIGRKRRNVDVGVREILYPTAPQFGQTIYPRVRIHNYGLDSIHNFMVCYRPYGTYLAHEAICPTWIPAGGDIEYEFPTPFTVTSNFPDTFEICAFTKVQSDYYRDNDTTCSIYGLSPLANDLYLYAITSPLASAVAGDSINITVRLRNFGQNEIDECVVRYLYNDNDTVTERIVFSDYLGRNLRSTEFFNYTFQHRERATMGTMRLTTWCEYQYDVYPYNDTISKEIAGISAITDMQATAGMIDNRQTTDNHICIVLDNVGARAANDFLVGYVYDRDPSTRFEEIFHRDRPLPAGGHTVHRFSRQVPNRSYEWSYIMVYCSVPGDTNQHNDTSEVIQPYLTDLQYVKIQVEENMSDSCRLRAVIRNNGNVSYLQWVRAYFAINGAPETYHKFEEGQYLIAPGEERHMLFPQRIPKSSIRQYIGSGRLMMPNADSDPTNDQTTIIEVVNYFEDVPRVDEPEFVLEQNYPNPYDGSTRIEFALPYSGSTRFFVTDVVGRLVHEETAFYSEGRHTLTFNKGSLPSGVYYYGLEFDGKRRMHKMIIH
jgi:hypothetical protein